MLGVDKRITEKAFDDEAFLSRKWNVPIPFLPVARRKEFGLFTALIRTKFPTFKEDAMALEWIKHVDGKDIYPKLPVQLRNYHRMWKKNARVQASMDQCDKEMEDLMKRIARQVPTAAAATDEDEIVTGIGETEANNPAGASAEDRNFMQRQIMRTADQAQAMNQRLVRSQLGVSVSQRGFRTHMRQSLRPAVFPFSMPEMLQDIAKRPADAPPFYAAGNLIGATVNPEPERVKKKARTKERGPDAKPRAPRRCMKCVRSGDPFRVENALTCCGRGGSGVCPRE